ncbi:MAG: hypothetical protein KZQ89_15470 [Candidatus Thiodiazotropha sp. (ex Lucinoma kastoroae)]|nr:hypothetical protein [Candidatus Thiodiazotropha sp. (ex Lucinoma kastoroae)]MCU7861104.1 hypothetical protein [Candidatus Thiodiazotropha sp. (ex Lucinoma kastoroae)]
MDTLDDDWCWDDTPHVPNPPSKYPHEDFAVSVWQGVFMNCVEEIGSEDWVEASIKLRSAAMLLEYQNRDDESGELILLSRIADWLASVTPRITDTEWIHRAEPYELAEIEGMLKSESD